MENIYNEAKDYKTNLAKQISELKVDLATLQALTTPSTQEQAKIRRINNVITKFTLKIADLDKQLTDVSTEHKTIRQEGVDLVTERNIIDTEIKDIHYCKRHRKGK